MVIIFGLAAFLATLTGGYFAIKYQDKLHLVLGFSAGAVLGVTFFDLLPESLNLTGDSNLVTTILAVGFIIFMLVDRFMLLHSHDDENCQNRNHRDKIGAGTLSIHSFIDGVGIGLAFKVSTAVGIIVTIAVLAHDFSDGLNTVNVIFKNKGTRQMALKWLIIDASAPLLGVISTLFFSIPEQTLGKILALFAGFFLYIGASDILPESHHRHPTYWTSLMTVLGIVILYTVIKLGS